MSIEKIIEKLKEENYEVKYLVEKTPKGKMVNLDLDSKIKSMYNFIGIEKLYEFQKKVIEELHKGKNVVISAPTASGKTEAFLYGVFKNKLEGKKTIIVYPTKALSRDQLKRFEYLKLFGVDMEIYDGDTPQGKRKKIRESPPSVLITNFDMLHFILLNHKKFERLFKNLSLMIIDEFHIYTGVFGSHVGNIINRLKRISEKVYNKKINFIVSSATVKNAKEFAENMIKEEFSLVEGFGNSKVIHHLVVKPFDSYLSATLKIASLLNKKTLIFANSHGSVERLGIMARNYGLDLWVYRAGLSKSYREELEKKFKTSNNTILASTSALELGIDIGSIEAVIMAGFAGKISSAKQRLGRAGRKGEGIAVFIARESPLDIYYAEHPELYIFKEAESCYANPSNPYILKYHLLAMAKENLLREEEIKGNEKLVEELVESKLLTKFGNFYTITKEGSMLVRNLSIRGVGEIVEIIDLSSNKIIGSREKSLAISELFEGAIYLHGGKTFISKKLDLDNSKAYVIPYQEEQSIYTKALSDKSADIVEEFESKEVGDLTLNIGKVNITTEVYGFLVKDVYSNSTIGEHTFEKPYISEMESNALWLDFNEIPYIENFGDALHGFEHVSIAMSPLLTGSDEKELGGISYSNGRMFIYEGIPGGIGLVDVLYKRFEELSKHTKNRLHECDCIDGCPKCIFDPMCGNDNRYLSKEGAKKLSEYILENFKVK